MDAWQAVTLALAALLVGALLPAVFQLTLALRAWRATAGRADHALSALAATVERVDRLAARLEASDRLPRFLEEVEGLAGAVSRAQEALRVAAAVGAAVGPAVGAAVRAWRAPGAKDAAAPGGAAVQSNDSRREDATT